MRQSDAFGFTDETEGGGCTVWIYIVGFGLLAIMKD
jgi:hypothetical protein